MTARQRQRVFNPWFTNTAGPTQVSAAAEETAWQDDALCSQVGGDAWFPDKGGSTREAKKVCRRCEVRADCLLYALEHDERFGIWGGKSERERRKLKRQAANA